MSIYKNHEAKVTMMSLYDEKLKACGFGHYEELFIETSFGKTHVIISGQPNAEPLVILHGINAGAPMAMEPVAHLNKERRLIGIDTPGQAGKSDERRLKMNSDEYGQWLLETLNGLNLEQVDIVAVSYGAFLLQKLIAFAPYKIKKAIFIVPSGFVSGSVMASMKLLSFPLIRFLMTKKDEHLKKFLSSFYSDIDKFAMDMQRTLLLDFKMDYSRPLLMKESESNGFDQPVYVMVADTDVFFPGPKALERCKKLFKNIKGTHLLKACKHIPGKERYEEIAKKIEIWLKNE